MMPSRAVGIIGYGAYVPRYRLPASEVSRVWRGGLQLEPIQEKSVPGMDEDPVADYVWGKLTETEKTNLLDPLLVNNHQEI